MEKDINKIIETLDSLDIKVLLNTGLDNRVILNDIKIWLNESEQGWLNYIDYLRSEYWTIEELDEIEKEYAEFYCKLWPHYQELEKKIDEILSASVAPTLTVLSKKRNYLKLKDYDILPVMKNTECNDLVKKLLLWTNKAIYGHFESKGWHRWKDGEWENKHSIFASLKNKLTMIYEVFQERSLQYKMNSLKSRWERVDKLTKIVETTENTVNSNNVKVTNVVYAD